MDKEPNNGEECGDGWRKRGGSITDRTVVVDGEPGESIPTQVKTPLVGKNLSYHSEIVLHNCPVEEIGTCSSDPFLKSRLSPIFFFATIFMFS